MTEMSKEAREARRRYYREWQRKNAKKRKVYEAQYWQRKAEEYREQDKHSKGQEA